MRPLTVIGGSAGALEPLKEIASRLAGYSGTVLVVLHVARDFKSMLPDVLGRAGPLRTRHAEDGMELASGTILVAPPDHHLIVEGVRVRLTQSARENRTRPAIDPLFRSAATEHGSGVVGVLLSGMLDDGTLGLAEIKLRGGLTIVQDPREARFPSMPQNAIKNVKVDRVLDAARIVDALQEHARAARRVPSAVPQPSMPTVFAQSPRDLATFDSASQKDKHDAMTCPQCRGVLRRTREVDVLYFTCHTGHAYSPLSLSHDQAQDVERSLAAAERALKERAILTYMRADRERGRNGGTLAAALDERAHRFEKAAGEVRGLLDRIGAGSRIDGVEQADPEVEAGAGGGD